MFAEINFVEIISAFVVLFAIIDVTGSIPVFLSLKNQQKSVKPWQASLASLILFVVFFYSGDALLKLFGVDSASFAVAGALVIFILALEMVLGIEIIKNEGGGNGASIVPIAFPLIAGPGALTALLSLRADHAVVNIMIALVLNILFAFIVLASIDKIEKILGKATIFILRKFFGVILLALAVKMFVSNISTVIATINPQL
ncbi:MAG: MarC family protein [Bacteroidales bacterium]|jgi:multiple antibiotic resistance protein|nr:MarC family protein [Bacteroidales bacterium]MBR5776909.1 MarC family protein [Bacteroidales bacterium]